MSKKNWVAIIFAASLAMPGIVAAQDTGDEKFIIGHLYKLEDWSPRHWQPD